ncbi:type VI secretion system tube protein Hcp [Portibacter marinus]|uniref:type VI secretion system tube protein Hcp n=1 Tax=Portibacter marinus TaxID=2898660 RepID=UPI001F2EC3F5|nr:type VI secretion system tube protein Hcp [Portibacter marinus]
MKTLLLLSLCFPLLLSAQNIGIGTPIPSEKLEVNGIIFSSQGGIKFPDGTIQTTAYSPPPGMMQNGLSAMVIEFAQVSGINVSGPAIDVEINNGINVQSGQEGVSVGVQLSGSTFDTSNPSLQEYNFSRISDNNTSEIRKLLLTGTEIPYIEVFNLRIYGEFGQYYIDHWTRYEGCIISNLSTSGSDFLSEAVSFEYKKACYRSYKRNPNDGSQTGLNEVCFDRTLGQTGCGCGW